MIVPKVHLNLITLPAWDKAEYLPPLQVSATCVGRVWVPQFIFLFTRNMPDPVPAADPAAPADPSATPAPAADPAVTPPAADPAPADPSAAPADPAKPADPAPADPAKPAEDPATPPADDEPPVRKTPAEYARERIANKKVKADPATPPGEIDPDDEAIVTQVLKKHGVLDSVQASNDQRLTGEIADFVAANPAFKGQESKIRKFASHDAYSRLPIEQAAYAACGKDLFKAGADQARETDAEAAATATGGGSARPQAPGTKDYSKLSNDEMEAEILAAKGVKA